MRGLKFECYEVIQSDDLFITDYKVQPKISMEGIEMLKKEVKIWEPKHRRCHQHIYATEQHGRKKVLGQLEFKIINEDIGEQRRSRNP